MATNRTFKGAPKPMGASGHFDEPRRHALQAQGIKTGHLATPIPMPNTPAQKPIPTPEPITFEDTLKADFAKQFGHDKDEIEVEEKDDYWEVKIGNEEYMVFADSDKAEQYAIEQVKEDLENEPGMFNQDWLSHHTSLSETDRNILANEGADRIVDDSDDNELLKESGLDEEWDELDARETELTLKEENIAEEEAELEKISEQKDKLVEDAKESVRESYHDETYDALADPFDWYVNQQGFGNAKDFFNAFPNAIDVDEAAQDAIDTDGVAHFLARYDGDEIELPSGAYAYRTN